MSSIREDDGWRVYSPYCKMPLKAQYGLLLIELCRQADRESEEVGKFVEHPQPTFEEFREMKRAGNKRNVYWDEMMRKSYER